MNLEDISTQLLYTTAPIWVAKEDGTHSGTSFIFSVPVSGEEDKQVPLLVTNKHIIEAAKKGRFQLHEAGAEGPKRGARLNVEIEADMLERHVDPDHDLAAVPIGGLLNQLQASDRPAFFRSVSPEVVAAEDIVQNLAAVEDITFIGYPSGLIDEHNATPLVRRGITATPPWNDFGGEPVFLIDAGVFPGSSGSPVFILNQGAYATRDGLSVGNRLLFMGIITETLLAREAGRPEAYLGLGKVLKGRVVMDFLKGVVAELVERERE